MNLGSAMYNSVYCKLYYMMHVLCRRPNYRVLRYSNRPYALKSFRAPWLACMQKPREQE